MGVHPRVSPLGEVRRWLGRSLFAFAFVIGRWFQRPAVHTELFSGRVGVHRRCWTPVRLVRYSPLVRGSPGRRCTGLCGPFERVRQSVESSIGSAPEGGFRVGAGHVIRQELVHLVRCCGQAVNERRELPGGFAPGHWHDESVCGLRWC